MMQQTVDDRRPMKSIDKENSRFRIPLQLKEDSEVIVVSYLMMRRQLKGPPND